VGGAIFCGFAMVLVLVIPLRKIYRLEEFITGRHLEMMGLMILATGWVVAYGYFTEFFTAWWSGDIYDHFVNANRALGPYAPAFWAMLACNVGVPQFLWSKTVRRSVPALFIIALLVNIGMWLERYVIVITSLHRDFLPSSWGMYSPTRWDWLLYLGTFGLFLTLLFLFVRFIPAIAMSEMRRQVAEPEEEG
jgi:molybdopterin-containing oxidoreductase family membrane subunit